MEEEAKTSPLLEEAGMVSSVLSAASHYSYGGAEGNADAGAGAGKGVSMGLEYRVCADRGTVVDIRDAAVEQTSSPGDGAGAGSSSISTGGLKKLGSSFTPTLEKAFSSKTGRALAMARGKSYEGEEFKLSWTITLRVPDRAGASGVKRFGKARGGGGGGGGGSAGCMGGSTPMKTILNGIVGEAAKGQLVAVMGSSGCGKTSFLDCLSMRNQSFTGNIFVNGKEIDGRYFSLAGFVHQEDLFIPTETVREHLLFHAMLRCDRCIRKEARVERVERLLKAVNLEHVAGSMLGGPGSFIRGLSGGERRRVSFATELLSDPVIIFADEFTTGLDAAMAKALCRSLRNIAYSGRLVIGTIHQPSSDVFNVFTHVMLMSQGRLVYMGPRKQLSSYFDSLNDPALQCPPDHNPADFYVQMIALNPDAAEGSQARIDFLVGAFQGSEEFAALSAWQQAVPYPDLLLVHRLFKMRHFQASGWTQFVYTFRRNVQALYRDPMNFAATLFSAVFSGLLLGLSYRGPPEQPATEEHVRNTTGLFFLASLMLVLISTYAAIMAFAAETKVFMRENQAGVNRVGSYFAAKMTSNWAVEVLVPFLYGLLIWWLAGLHRGAAAFFVFQAAVVLLAICASSIGYCLASITADEKIAFALLPPILFPSTIFSGTLYDLHTAHGVRKFLSYLSLIRYAVGSMTQNEFQRGDTGRYTDPAIPNAEAAWHKVAAYPLADNMIALAGFAVVIRLLAYGLLHRRTSRERVKVP